MNYKHGHAARPQSPTYRSWSAMIRRCYNPSNDSYPFYGGRGITVCEPWKIFSNFLADMGERPKGMDLDRINSDDNYEKENCRWASHKTNCRHMKGVVLDLEAAGEIRMLAMSGRISHKEIARTFGVSRATVTAIVSRRLWRD